MREIKKNNKFKDIDFNNKKNMKVICFKNYKNKS